MTLLVGVQTLRVVVLVADCLRIHDDGNISMVDKIYGIDGSLAGAMSSGRSHIAEYSVPDALGLVKRSVGSAAELFLVVEEGLKSIIDRVTHETVVHIAVVSPQPEVRVITVRPGQVVSDPVRSRVWSDGTMGFLSIPTSVDLEALDMPSLVRFAIEVAYRLYLVGDIVVPGHMNQMFRVAVIDSTGFRRFSRIS